MSQTFDEQILADFEENTIDNLHAYIEKHCTYPALYALSPLRANIIEWIPMRGDEQVLEIGSGCGIISGVLASKCAQLDCIESSAANAINRQINISHTNIRILEGSPDTVETELLEQYDYIFAIDCFALIQNPKTLTLLKNHLSPKGCLVFTAENRMGLRYLSGCTDPYSGTFFGGIEGMSSEEGACAMTLPQITQLCKAAGFLSLDIRYPYPDHLFTKRIYSNKHLPQIGELNDNYSNFDSDRMVSFNEARAFDRIVLDGQFPYFSNSFLILASPFERRPVSDIVFSKYSNERSRFFGIRTDILEDGKGSRMIRKTALTSDAYAHVQALFENEGKLSEEFADTCFRMNHCIRHDDSSAFFEYLSGVSLEKQLDDALSDRDMDSFLGILNRYKQQMYAAAKNTFSVTPQYTAIFGDLMPYSNEAALSVTNVDHIFQNIIESDGLWHVFDYEWTFDMPLPVKYVFYRAALYYGEFERRDLLRNQMGIDLFRLMDISDEEQALYAQMEDALQAYFYGEYVRLWTIYQKLGRQSYDTRSLLSNFWNAQAERDALRTENEAQKATIQTQQQVLSDIQKQLDTLANSSIWKATKPLRSLLDKIRHNT